MVEYYKTFFKIFNLKILIILILGLLINKPDVCYKNYCRILSVAITEKERIKWLKHVKNIHNKEALLFIFPDEDYRWIWMKDTNINLDVIRMDRYFRIIDIKKLKKCNKKCEVFYPLNKAKYVLEIKENLSNALNMNIWDYIFFK